ncbi:hypothetical protein [Neobacillus ginsengisoli]|uniref:Uncharacterized protein n=1 Tax=Neobacillus ginsengisoli TaxID=904295 RepID=A0ABT9XY98_9BACI|nr:hypothetical protein [Neobacillus ginsengisoli]MDQ0200368.1 hypothetical protein [Neobacillus ginsengisoli]
MLNYDDFLKSFQGIGHLNLIKLYGIFDERDGRQYFFESETIEGSRKGVTYFAYYYGFVQLTKEQNHFKIQDISLVGEDFLCAAYHGWDHDAEAVVEVKYGNWCKLIKKIYPTRQHGYVKHIFINGTDGNDYLFVFIELTNGTDVEITQYKKYPNGQWIHVHMKPEKCVE